MIAALLPFRWFVRPAQALAAGGLALLLTAASSQVHGNSSPILIVEATALGGEARALAAGRALALLHARADVAYVRQLTDDALRERLARVGAPLSPEPLPLPTLVEARLGAGVWPGPAMETLRHVPGLRVNLIEGEAQRARALFVASGIAAAAILTLAALAEARTRASAVSLLERLGATPGQLWGHLLTPAAASVAVGASTGSLIGSFTFGEGEAHLVITATITVAATAWNSLALLVAAWSGRPRP